MLEPIRAPADQPLQRVLCLYAGSTGYDQLKADAV
jgi:hypothetical protein